VALGGPGSKGHGAYRAARKEDGALDLARGKRRRPLPGDIPSGERSRGGGGGGSKGSSSADRARRERRAARSRAAVVKGARARGADLRVVKRRDAVNGRGEGGNLSPGARRERKDRTSRGRRAVALLGLILALALMAAVLYRPVTHYLESRRELARAEAQLDAERALTRDLEERRERASSEDYVEGEARRMGYVKPGEIPLIVLDDVEKASGQEEGQATP